MTLVVVVDVYYKRREEGIRAASSGRKPEVYRAFRDLIVYRTAFLGRCDVDRCLKLSLKLSPFPQAAPVQDALATGVHLIYWLWWCGFVNVLGQ